MSARLWRQRPLSGQSVGLNGHCTNWTVLPPPDDVTLRWRNRCTYEVDLTYTSSRITSLAAVSAAGPTNTAECEFLSCRDRLDAQLRSILHCRQLYRVNCHVCRKNSPPNCLRTLAHSGPIYLAHFIGNFAELEKNLRFKEFIKRFWMFKNQKPILPALKYRNWNATAHLADLRGGGQGGHAPKMPAFNWYAVEQHISRRLLSADTGGKPMCLALTRNWVSE